MDDNKKIKELRKEKQIPQKNIAIDLGISQGALSKIENGRIKLTETRMKELADCLGVTPDEIKEFGNKSVSINIEVDGDNSGNNGNVNTTDQIALYEQIIQDKNHIISLQASTIKDKDVIISLLQAKINEFLEKEK